MPVLPFVSGRYNRSVTLFPMTSGTGRNSISVFLTCRIYFLSRSLLVMSDRSQFFRLCSLTSGTETVFLSLRCTACREVRNPVSPTMAGCYDNRLRPLLSVTSRASCNGIPVRRTGCRHFLGCAACIMSEFRNLLGFSVLTFAAETVFLPLRGTSSRFIRNPVSIGMAGSFNDCSRTYFIVTF